MDIRTEFLPKVVIQKHPNDKSYSKTGLSDFVDPEPSIFTIAPKGQAPVPGGPINKSRKQQISESNSYT